MLCGLHPNSTGIHRNAQIFRQTIPSHISLPQAFRREGYFAARIGKLYHYNVPKSVGTNGHIVYHGRLHTYPNSPGGAESLGASSRARSRSTVLCSLFPVPLNPFPRTAASAD
jgi:arylsulfatase A-like enzyme